jgi:short-subunit dehydrogenase
MIASSVEFLPESPGNRRLNRGTRMNTPSSDTTRSNRRVALVTGASAGIGKAYAQQLAERGYDLIAVARREDRLRELREELEPRHGVRVEPLPADLADDEAVGRVVAMIESRDDLEVLVNNAGFGVSGRFHEADADRNMAMIRVHALATARLTRAALPQMVDRDLGYVVNVSSLAGFLTSPGAVAYCATKAFLNSFSISLQAELRGTGVRIQALCPGFTYSEFHDLPDAKMDRGLVPRFMWMSADQVVSISLRAMKRRKVICVPGLVNRGLAVVLRSHLLDPFMYWGYGRRLKEGGPCE